LLSFVLFGAAAAAQPGDRRLDTNARVLDNLFPLEVEQNPYFLKLILRFGDSDEQVVVVIYPDKEKYWVRRCEVTKYSLDGRDNKSLSQIVSKMIAQYPDVTPQEIAAKLRLKVSRSSIAPEALNPALDELKTIRIPPVLADRVAVDEYSEYEYWYDNWQESVHYSLVGDSGREPQDRLWRWMVKFRASLPDLLRDEVRLTNPHPPNESRTSSAARLPVKVSLGVAERMLIHRENPAYPQLARSALAQGTVTLVVRISDEGTVHDIRVIDGHPLLVSSAIDAVKKWRYRPYLLEGQPVEVETQVQVKFSLLEP
jgi:TonB family protein